MVRPANLKEHEFTGLRGRVAAFVENNRFINTITAIIFISAIVLGLETDASIMERFGSVLKIIDKIILGVFIIELSLKLYIYRLSFFRSGWNLFDFIIVAVSLIPANETMAVLRALRILRVLRLLSIIPSMRRVIAALGHAIPGMGSIIAVLLIIFYVCAVLATKLFAGHPVPEIAAMFESVGASMFTLFQIMTLESWSAGIVRPVMEVYPHAWVFFIPFVIITSFAVLNLFIGIIVDAMNVIHEQKEYAGPERRSGNRVAREELEQLRKDISEIKSDLKKALKK